MTRNVLEVENETTRKMAGRVEKWSVENSAKNDNKIVQKVIDLSTIRAYNRDNF